MNVLLFLALALVALWVAAEIFGWVLGAALNLLWIGALILLAIWIVQKVRARV
ncbi:MAG: hypothetical protein ACODAB_00245 [Gemmatimonadota bacterium]